MPEAWVYLLRCRDRSLYTGWTVDLERRLARHRSGLASHYTASRLPVELALAIPMPDRTSARRVEARIKRLPRPVKLALLTGAHSPGEPVGRPVPTPVGTARATDDGRSNVCCSSGSRAPARRSPSHDAPGGASSYAGGVPIFRFLKGRAAKEEAVLIGDPRVESWESVSTFEDQRTAVAWRDQLRSMGVDASCVADHPLDRFGRGDIYLMVPPEQWSRASEIVDNID
jgi:putative endonuclease